MTVARSSGILIGTDETTGVTIANNANSTSSEIDVLGADSVEGWINLFLKFTSTVTAGSLDVTLFYSRISGQSYQDNAPIIATFSPINGTLKCYCGQFRLGRYMAAKVANNATTQSATNVTLGYELFKES